MNFVLKYPEINCKNPSYSKNDKIYENIKEWNTIPHIYRLKNLYELCSKLYLLTCDKKLACLNYYVDHEKDNDTGKEYIIYCAEIKDTWDLPIKERFKQHAKLLKRVMSNDTTLIYFNSITQTEESGQLTLFS